MAGAVGTARSLLLLLLWMPLGTAGRQLLALQGDRVEQSRMPCPAGCSTRGNCNYETGRCECPWGWSGDACEVDSMAACRQTPDDPGSCGLWFPKNCECLRACFRLYCPHGASPTVCRHAWAHDAEKAGCWLYGNDATGTAGALERPQNSSWYPNNPQQETIWYDQIPEFAGKKTYDEELRTHDPRRIGYSALIRPDVPHRAGYNHTAHPLSHCAGTHNCSNGRGNCFRWNHLAEPQCMCRMGFNGSDCSGTESSMACWMSPDCGGVGACRSGFCQCPDGRWGWGCHRTAAYRPPQQQPRQERPGEATELPDLRPVPARLRIYMYDLPWHVTFPQESIEYIYERDINYLAEEYFLRYFLNDSTVRTENPYEAHLFYIPVLNFFHSANVHNPSKQTQHVIDHVRRTWPFYNRSGGADHFLFAPGDLGSCHMHRWMQDDVIKVVHFGMQVRNSWWADIANKEYGCMQIKRDLVVPPTHTMFLGEAADTWRALEASGGRDPNRTRLLVFAGVAGEGNPQYSGGARQALLRLFANATHAEGVDVLEGRAPGYRSRIRTSKFCFAPYGYGFGNRLVQAVHTGCIPLIIQDGVHQPFEDEMPYEDFAVRLPMRDLPRVVEVLRSYGEDRLAAMRLTLAGYYRAFIWHREHGGRAYEWTLEGLKKRAYALAARHFGRPSAAERAREQALAEAVAAWEAGRQQGGGVAYISFGASDHGASRGQPVASGRELALAIASAVSGGPEVVQLEVAEVNLTDSDWLGISVPLLLPAGRNLTIRGSPDLPTGPPILRMPTSPVLKLLDNCTLVIEGVILEYFVQRNANFFRTPSLSILDHSPDGTQGALVLTRNLAAINAFCLPSETWVQNVLAAARPALLPGVQRFQPNADQGGCVNDTSVPPLQRCWVTRYLALDVAAVGVQLNAVGNPVNTHYDLDMVNLTVLCPVVLDRSCVASLGPLGCMLLYERGVAGGLLPGATSPPPPAASASTAGGGSGGRSGPSPMLTGCIVGGVVLLLLMLALAGLLVRRRWGAHAPHAQPSPLPPPKCLRESSRNSRAVSGSLESGTLHQGIAAEADNEGEELKEEDVCAVFSTTSGPGAWGVLAIQGSAFATAHVVSDLTPLPAELAVALRVEPPAGGRDGREAEGAGPDVEDTAPVVRLTGLVLGKGSFGRVYEGTYQGRLVAVKQLLEGPCEFSPGAARSAQETYLQELEVLGRCDHPNIVKVLAACVVDTARPVMVLERMDTSLDKVLYGSPGTLLPLRLVLHIAIQIAQGLSYLHPTILHRDLKPANVLVSDPQGEVPLVKLSDFGLSRLRHSVLRTDRPEAGTPAYMSPECFDLNCDAITHRTDCYSFGVLLWEMLAGTHPWAGMSAVQIAYEVALLNHRLSVPPPTAPGGSDANRWPPRLRSLLTACFERDPRRRPAAAEAVKALALALEELDRPPSLRPSAERPSPAALDRAPTLTRARGGSSAKP
ncbi:hypothetical protein HYH03_009221 [Edaphochlamys debaryana]|uniref:Uncharacterized protein n=1 Tax=Edaphochlamys debaryana TaxID=47281 RepID=A0A835Y7S1_9CHLO|nr:hypothetical protein HYH03_009221 [Edaphochlamys debaryana]|eukprot:KAG2492559.1 hypothetical protein HYH03_009221 [Edaphochlamys debaryana]